MFDSTINQSVLSATIAKPVEQPQQPRPLRESVRQAMDHYLAQLDGQEVTELYDLVLSEVEAPMLEAIMQFTRGNQTKASQMMGINRGTLRKKLKRYGMS